jgi:hypothetical protein
MSAGGDLSDKNGANQFAAPPVPFNIGPTHAPSGRGGGQPRKVGGNSQRLADWRKPQNGST